MSHIKPFTSAVYNRHGSVKSGARGKQHTHFCRGDIIEAESCFTANLLRVLNVHMAVRCGVTLTEMSVEAKLAPVITSCVPPSVSHCDVVPAPVSSIHPDTADNTGGTMYR